MRFQKKWNFGIGTIFSLIVVYFIFLYSRDKGWAVLAFISKWYLIIAIGLTAISLGIALLVILVSLLMLLIASIRLRKFSQKHKKEKSKDYVDVEYNIKN